MTVMATQWKYAGDRYPGFGGAVHAQDDGYAGFWGDMSNIYGHKVWNLVPVDEEFSRIR